MRRLFFAAVALLIALPSGAKEAAPASADPALERRVMALAEELRCLVCQNQTLADSHAALALDLKDRVREQLKDGKTDREVLDFMVARYGDFVLYRPPLRATTLLLWGGPFLLLLGALAGMVMFLRRNTSEAEGDGAA